MRPLTRATGPLALAVALLALLVAVGGTSYAAVTLAKNSVGAKQLKAGAVTGAKVKDASLTAADFAAGQVGGGAAGPAGPAGTPGQPGQPGQPGPAGAPGAVSGWAELDGTGDVLRTGGAKPLTDADVTRAAVGTYRITGAGWGAFVIGAQTPVGVTLKGSLPGSASFTSPTLSGSPPAIVPTTIRTFDKNGDLTDRGTFVWIP